jgi:hypothetical protein
MPDDGKKSSILVPAHEDYVGSIPFEPGRDVFGRKQLADQLTRYVSRLNDGCVFAIDAPWGDGKTWFAKNWEAQLRDVEGYTTIYLDAFERDYIDDPFLLISAEILEAVGDRQPEGLVDASKKVGKALLPVAGKIAVNVAGRFFLGSVNIADDLKKFGEDIDRDVSDAAEKFIEKRLDEYKSDKQSIKHFKEKLAQFSATQDKPIIILIDELDRCKPTFAVQMIERIKHFFDVPRLIFVLLLNQKQLEASIRGVYGVDMDAHIYLRKFIQFTLTLPKRQSVHDGYQDFNRIYCKRLSNRFGLEGKQSTENFNETFSIFATLLTLTLRDLERGYVLFSMAQPIEASTPILAYLIALKLAKPDLYRGLANGEIPAHKEAVVLTSSWTIDDAGNNHELIRVLNMLHQAHLTSFKEVPRELADSLRDFGRGRDAKNVFPSLFGKIDLSIRD